MILTHTMHCWLLLQIYLLLMTAFVLQGHILGGVKFVYVVSTSRCIYTYSFVWNAAPEVFERLDLNASRKRFRGHLTPGLFSYPIRENTWSDQCNGHPFMTLYSPGRTDTSLHYFCISAHAQYFPVSVFNPIKCLHVLSLRLQKE